METIIKTTHREKFLTTAVSAAPYIFTLYFIEIAYFTPALIYHYGKWTGILITLILTAVYTAQIISLYMKYNAARLIQLILMDLHAAFTIGYMANFISGMEGFGMPDYFLFSIRLILLTAEFAAITALTSARIKSLFRQTIPSPRGGR